MFFLCNLKFEMEKSMESSIKSSLSQEELFVEQFNTPYMKDKPHDYSNFSLHRKRKSANFNVKHKNILKNIAKFILFIA